MIRRQPPSLAALSLGAAALVAGGAISTGCARGTAPARSMSQAVTAGGTPPRDSGRAQPTAPDGRASAEAMLWKYVSRCALRAGETVNGPDGGRFEGAFGLSPEWRDGVCDQACQEKVSACLFALTNPTGKHVEVSLLGRDASLPRQMRPSDVDLPYPYQEGAFFGNVFAGEAFVCRGADAPKGAEVKRWCAIAPALCSGLADFVDAGPCAEACTMSCSRLRDGSARCVATRCRDPRGHVWTRPITTYLRKQIEAGNADAIARAASLDQHLERIEDGATATFREVDFGPARRDRAFIARVTSPRPGGRIEVWLGDERRLGVLMVEPAGKDARDLEAVLAAEDLSGPRDLVLRFSGFDPAARVEWISVR